MLNRIISGLIIVCHPRLHLWSANPYWFIALAVVAIMLGMHEFYSLAQRVGLHCERWLAFAAGAAILVGFFLFGSSESFSRAGCGHNCVSDHRAQPPIGI